mmetsp:Transcript_10037/g.14926  ORF Transcript_10037/g.14926 Transcript_10037/m.14926 type:complete len:531 (-) Transcript_10037:137-1729(-)|eukprot:CAMPEP_0196819228 /NCGR_PEP_ID=MMETSP1362-20130617/69628_1 /TAXON_ID=163516 /ORGANISM="Leptocylindrus danicus, Strain CCMP1856" /LENGTH=530 /DNA_ID=CAMNT_0042197633 /DNA_START=247 /DNA_END=1839 /DNA_ORIENTATION=+
MTATAAAAATAGPISSVSKEALLSKTLRISLRSQGLYELDEGHKKRVEMLKQLREVLKCWATNTTSVTTRTTGRNNRSENVTICTFGSFRLGVNHPDADIDVLVLSPPHCTRSSFFTVLVELLRGHDLVTDLHPVPSAYTPVIKFKLGGVSIDLVYASSSMHVENSNDFMTRIEDEHLVGLEVDEPGMRSINGVRVAQLLLEMVEGYSNLDSFRESLRAVKQWATVKGLYSNVLGFLGGVNWAILVAHICERHPQSTPSTILCEFFRIFSEWNWPKPVMLENTGNNYIPGIPRQTVWNPKVNRRDGTHLMPILTPAYPSMNSAYNVGHPQKRRLQEELEKARELTVCINKGKKNWAHLFSTTGDQNFFRQHQNFLQITIEANGEASFRKWFGFCEARMRILIVSLDSPVQGVEAHPFAKFFYNDVNSVSFFIALRFAHGVENINISDLASEFLYKVNSWEERREGMDLKLEHKLQQDLPAYILFPVEEKKQKTTKKVDNKRKQKNATLQSFDVSSPTKRNRQFIKNQAAC